MFKKIKTIRGVAVYFASLLIGFICILLIGCISCKNNIYYRYEVTIDENVNKEEFIDKYEIINKRGKMVTEPQYDLAWRFSEALASVKINALIPSEKQ